MPSALDEIGCARIPRESLDAVAALRCTSGIEVIEDGAHCWLRWEPGNDDVLRQVLPLPGVSLFVRRGLHWHPHDSRLPGAGPPDRDARPLDGLLAPDRIQPIAADTKKPEPVRLQLVRDDVPRTVTALECALAELSQWAETATSPQIARLRGALSGQRVLLRGERLPLLGRAAGSIPAVRFWGRRLLVPVGFRPEPALPESAWPAVLRLESDELALLRADSVTIVSASVLVPLSRAAIRLACREQVR